MSTKRTNSQLLLLNAATLREDRCLVPSPTLKGGVAQKVAAKLIAEGVVKEIKAKAEAPVWRRDHESGHTYALKLTAVGIKRVAARTSGKWRRRAEKLRRWSLCPHRRVAPTRPLRCPRNGKAAPREGSKLASVIALLRRSEGATSSP